MQPLDPKIDDLYKGPLKEFVAARGALAKTLAGADAKRIKGLPKPTVVPWAVNQLYWHARPVYDRLVSSGEKLRSAQIDALKGRQADVRRATDAHRKAMADAVTEARRLASADDAHPGADELTKTLETVSLARDLPEEPGRLTKPLRPAGFEALAGVPVQAVPRPPAPVPGPATTPKRAAKTNLIAEKKRDAEERRRNEAKERGRKIATERAEGTVARAKVQEARTREAWERAKRDVASAELALSKIRRP